MTTFSELKPGDKCLVIKQGQLVEVEKTDYLKSGSTAYNARRTQKTGRSYGRCFVYGDMHVTPVENAASAKFDAANEPQGNNGEPLITSEWQPGDDALAEQAEEAAYMHSHPANGWGL